jgi:hypothetical protein
MLDTSRLTVCRNEVNAIPGSDFARVGGELFPEDFGSVHLSALRDAISRADVRRSARDRLSQVDKEYLSVVGRAGLGITGKHRLRRVLSVTGLIDDPGEWDLPDLFLNKDRMSHVRLVLKLNSCPAWAMALGKEDERCKILHNIRDPFEYLQSWYNRFIKSIPEHRHLKADLRMCRDFLRILVETMLTGSDSPLKRTLSKWSSGDGGTSTSAFSRWPPSQVDIC